MRPGSLARDEHRPSRYITEGMACAFSALSCNLTFWIPRATGLGWGALTEEQGNLHSSPALTVGQLEHRYDLLSPDGGCPSEGPGSPMGKRVAPFFPLRPF